MTQLAYDSFTRANQSGWGTATDGQVWTMPIGTGTVAISGNEGTITSALADTDMQLGTNTYTDMELLYRASISNSGDIIGLEGRFSVSGGQPTSYKFLFYSGGVHINKGILGANTNLVNATVTININTFYWYRFRIVGIGLYGKVWQDGTAEPSSWTLQTTDSSIASGGFAVLGNTATTNLVSFDSFYVVDYALVDANIISDVSKPSLTFLPIELSNSTEIMTVNIASSIIETMVITEIAIPIVLAFITDILISSDLLQFSTTNVGNIRNYMLLRVTIRSGRQNISVR